ncbi:hypothetical protein [Methylomonas albis]|uniref:Uncharacterized protein n=1 Tax=Methylomonas albis TaxID=1854563 RepID=A0ABR9D301_9GAMM|nr:hypothetical protein [Methylomonas albis]MBD9357499.1 hypothetical protein [Methylomonas albis]
MDSLLQFISEIGAAVFPKEMPETIDYWFVPLVWAGFLIAVALSAGNRRD